MTKHRSAASLLASGAATITLNPRLRVPKVISTVDALRADREAIARDGRRAMRRLTDDLSRF